MAHNTLYNGKISKNMKNQIVHETFQNESYDFFDFFWIENEILRRMDLSKLKMDIWWKIMIFQHILGSKPSIRV